MGVEGKPGTFCTPAKQMDRETLCKDVAKLKGYKFVKEAVKADYGVPFGCWTLKGADKTFHFNTQVKGARPGNMTVIPICLRTANAKANTATKVAKKFLTSSEPEAEPESEPEDDGSSDGDGDGGDGDGSPEPEPESADALLAADPIFTAA